MAKRSNGLDASGDRLLPTPLLPSHDLLLNLQSCRYASRADRLHGRRGERPNEAQGTHRATTGSVKPFNLIWFNSAVEKTPALWSRIYSSETLEPNMRTSSVLTVTMTPAS